MASYTVNKAAVTFVRELIDKKRYVLDSDWGEAQPSAAEQNAYLDKHSWEDYAAWHLGLTEGANDETKARYAFVVGDFSRVHRTGLIACVYRASEWRHKDTSSRSAAEFTRDRSPGPVLRPGACPAAGGR